MPQKIRSTKILRAGGIWPDSRSPVVNVWGFGPGGTGIKRDSADIKFIKFSGILIKSNFEQKEVRKTVPGESILDFSVSPKRTGRLDVIAETFWANEAWYWKIPDWKSGGELGG